MRSKKYHLIPEKNNQGYSMIEAMAAIGIMSIAILGIISMQTSSGNSVRQSGDSTIAISLGTARLERLMSYSYSDLFNGTINTTPASELQGPADRFTVEWAAVVDTPVTNTARITVDVTWLPQTGGTGRQTITLTAVKADMNL